MDLKATATGAIDAARRRAPWLDHLVQAGRRYGADQGNQLAAAVTYFSFLSLFPLLLLAVSVLGFVLNGNPELRDDILRGVKDALPGGSAEVIDGVVNSRTTVGLVGLVGMLYTGTGWVDNLRTAVRTVWHQNVSTGNIVKAKLNDLVVLVGLGLTFAVSVGISGVGNAATSWVIDLLGVADVPGISLATKLASIAIAMVANIGIFLWLFIRLPRVQTPWRRVLKGAVFAAVGFEILKLAGAYYVQRTTANATATYGTLGVVIGALVWINLVSRFMIFSAVWTVTAPYDDDVAPSGTADEGLARQAGIPPEFAKDTPSDAAPNTRQLNGAPTPLTPALQDRPGVGYGGDAAAAAAAEPVGPGTAEPVAPVGGLGQAESGPYPRTVSGPAAPRRGEVPAALVLGLVSGVVGTRIAGRVRRARRR